MPASCWASTCWPAAAWVRRSRRRWLPSTACLAACWQWQRSACAPACKALAVRLLSARCPPHPTRPGLHRPLARQGHHLPSPGRPCRLCPRRRHLPRRQGRGGGAAGLWPPRRPQAGKARCRRCRCAPPLAHFLPGMPAREGAPSGRGVGLCLHNGRWGGCLIVTRVCSPLPCWCRRGSST